MLKLDAARKEQGEGVTSVWWDITRCPLPPDVDARLVGPFIKRELKKLGYSGPITITAIGILSEVSNDVLKDLASTGIHLHHVPTDFKPILCSLWAWTYYNRPPANIMVISPQEIFGSFLEQQAFKYNILGPIYKFDPVTKRPPRTMRECPGCFPWENLLSSIRADAMYSNPGALEEEGECNRMAESTLYCSSCLLGLRRFDYFTSHLETTKHAIEELEYYDEGIVPARKFRSRSRSEDATAIRELINQIRESKTAACKRQKRS